MPQPWKRISSQPLGDFRIFTLRSDRKISPRSGEAHDFFVIDSVNWVNVIALTPDQQLVMVEQYRHGIQLGSNYLMLDGHIESKAPKEAEGGLDPWDIPATQPANPPPGP